MIGDNESLDRVELKKLGFTILIVLTLSFIFPVLAPGAGVGLLLGGTYIYKKSGKGNVKKLSTVAVAAGVVLLAFVSYYLVCMSVVDSETTKSTGGMNGGVTNYTVGIYGENRLGQKQWGYFQRVSYNSETDNSTIDTWHESYGFGWSFKEKAVNKSASGPYFQSFSQAEFVLRLPQPVEHKYPWIEQRIHSNEGVEVEAGGVLKSP